MVDFPINGGFKLGNASINWDVVHCHSATLQQDILTTFSGAKLISKHLHNFEISWMIRKNLGKPEPLV